MHVSEASSMKRRLLLGKESVRRSINERRSCAVLHVYVSHHANAAARDLSDESAFWALLMITNSTK